MREKELIKACKRSDLRAVQELLYETKVKRASLLPKTDEIESRKTIKRLTHIDVNCRESKYQMTPLMIASLQGSRDIVVFLIYFGANVNLRDSKGNTSLQLACMKQKYSVIYTLLKNGSNPNDINSSGWNCLISAVNYFNDESAIMLLMLLQAGVKSEHKDNSGLMVIDHCVKRHKTNSIRIILNYNTKLAQFCSRALVNACIKGYFDIVLLLLNFGVNPNKIDIITGTGAQHESVRYYDLRDEKLRDIRLKIVQYLAIFGADPQLVNTRGETPMKLATDKNPRVPENFIQALKAFYRKPHRIPKFINPKAKTVHELIKIPKYPLLKPRSTWTRDDFRFCSTGYTHSKKNSVTNLLDGNLLTSWSVSGRELIWIVFDLKADHTITKIKIYGWDSKEMPNECHLQASNSLEGPWNIIQTFQCDMIGSTSKDAPGYPQEFDKFIATAQYWRLAIVDNHGAHQTSFHGIEFFGYDNRVTKILDQLKLNELEDILFENDLNQVEALVNCTKDNFDELSIENETDKLKLWNFIVDINKRVSGLKKLEWLYEPPKYCLVGETLEPFGAFSQHCTSGDLQLICHGGAVLKGDTHVSFEVPDDDSNETAVALFNNISFEKPGKFLLEIQCLSDTNVYIAASQPIIVYDLNDPRYPGERKSKRRVYKVPPLQRFQSTETEDYQPLSGRTNELPSFPMRSTNWLRKSSFLDNTSDDTLYELSDNRIDRYVYFTNSREPPVDYDFDDKPKAIEFEIQEFTLDFDDEQSEEFDLNTTLQNNLQQEESLEFEPKTEARVFINNPPLEDPSTYFASKSSLYGHFHADNSKRPSLEQEHEIIIVPPPPPPMSPKQPEFQQNEFSSTKKPSVSFHPDSYQEINEINTQQQRESRFIKQNTPSSKNLKIIKNEAVTEQAPQNNSLNKKDFSKARSSRETPSPHTIDRILDEVFEDISEDSPYILINGNSNGLFQREESYDFSLDDNTESLSTGNGITDVTFTDKARKVLNEYRKNTKQDSEAILL